MRHGAIAVALFLGGALTVGLLLLLSHSAHGAPLEPAGLARAPGAPAQEMYYYRVQTVTLHAPGQSDIYTTAYTTTFQFEIRDFVLGSWLRLPSDAVTHTATCIHNNAPTDTCTILWGTDVVTFAGPPGTRGTIYLAYDTRSRAWRSPDARVITLTYPVGPFLDELISLTNTLLYSRSLEPVWEPAFVTPTGYTHDEDNRVLRWEYTSTLRRVFTATFTELWLGSDLTIDGLEMSDSWPKPGDTVHFTVTVRNVGPYTTGRAVLTELFVRPRSVGPPIRLEDHYGGWISYTRAALFKWLFPAEHQVFLPLVTQGSSSQQLAASEALRPVLPGSYWWPGLGPGQTITGTTTLEWPAECITGTCGVWVKVDPTYLDLGVAYDWYGYNPEGFACERDERGLPICEEENNNMLAYYPTVHLPLVLRNYRPMRQVYLPLLVQNEEENDD